MTNAERVCVLEGNGMMAIESLGEAIASMICPSYVCLIGTNAIIQSLCVLDCISVHWFYSCLISCLVINVGYNNCFIHEMTYP